MLYEETSDGLRMYNALSNRKYEEDVFQQSSNKRSVASVKEIGALRSLKSNSQFLKVKVLPNNKKP